MRTMPHHRVQVVKTVHQCRDSRELLAESVAEVVGWVCRDDQHSLPQSGQLSGETTRARGLAHTSLPANEDPFELHPAKTPENNAHIKTKRLGTPSQVKTKANGLVKVENSWTFQ